MQVTKLRLAGFKSFGHPTELLIEPGLTGIVGPNGCGKSNLVDALRWVMGETSARGLRGDDMDAVIFAGTVARPPFDQEVELHLRGAAPVLPELGDDDELQLSRRIGRWRRIGVPGERQGAGARRPDPVRRCRLGRAQRGDHRSGPDRRIVDAKPADRRRLLEEAAGIGGLQARRHEAELKLQAAETNLLRCRISSSLSGSSIASCASRRVRPVATVS